MNILGISGKKEGHAVSLYKSKDGSPSNYLAPNQCTSESITPDILL